MCELCLLCVGYYLKYYAFGRLARLFVGKPVRPTVLCFGELRRSPGNHEEFLRINIARDTGKNV